MGKKDIGKPTSFDELVIIFLTRRRVDPPTVTRRPEVSYDWYFIFVFVFVFDLCPEDFLVIGSRDRDIESLFNIQRDSHFRGSRVDEY